MSGGLGRQRCRRDGAEQPAGGALVHEQGSGRKGGWPVGHPVEWSPAGGGDGDYDRWARPGKWKRRKENGNQIEFKIGN
jgi:hypothetical protein